MPPVYIPIPCPIADRCNAKVTERNYHSYCRGVMGREAWRNCRSFQDSLLKLTPSEWEVHIREDLRKHQKKGLLEIIKERLK